ncbi:MAG: hypothetical protein PHH00_00780 [Candidatus Nanoarchaeia archaeon]|nr:hypothetical protein [Candidatus Nanoarchaeia archaeon]
MDTKESQLVAKTREGFFKRLNDRLFKRIAYIFDRTPMDETISADNCLVTYSHYAKNYESD